MAEAIGKKMRDQNMVIAKLIGAVTGTTVEDEPEEGDEDEAEGKPETAPEFDYKAILARQTAHLQGK